MNVLLFYNSKSGTIKDSPQILDHVKKLIEEKLNDNDELNSFDVIENSIEDVIENFKDKNELKILIAGGDGTISSVINRIYHLNLTVGILPLGTFNNFSKSIKLPQNIEPAIEEIFSGKTIEIDLAKVNDKIFINNSSVGVYTKLVAIREESQLNLNLNKPTAMLLSLVKTIFLFPLIKVSMQSENISRRVKTPVTVISNNKYKFRLDAIGERKSLNEGLLYLHVIKCRTRFCVMKIFIKGLFNMLDEEKDFELVSSKEIELNIKKKFVEVAADGEIYKMKPPLKYQILPKSLCVMVPGSYE